MNADPNSPESQRGCCALGPHIALVGMMGCGKTTIGRLLSAQLDQELLDLDSILVEEQGMSIPEMFSVRGEPWFRDAESDLVARVMAQDRPRVVSVGGGAVLRERNRFALHDRALVVWLRASIETLLARNGNGFGRPMLAGDPQQRIRTLTTERAPKYLQTCHVTVDVDDLTTAQVVECVRAAIRSQCPTHWGR